MAFKLKDWVTVPWSDVEQDEIVRTADGRQWRVKGPWSGTRVLLHPLLPGDGVPVSPALTDGTKQVEVLRHRPADPGDATDRALAKFGQPTTPGAAYEQAVAEQGAPDFGRPMTPAEQEAQLDPVDPMTPGMPDPCQPIGCDNGVHRPGCTFAEPAAPVVVWGTADPTGTRSGMAPVPLVLSTELPGRKFGQPAADLTAAEQRDTEPADDEGRAVAELARHGLAPELVSVEEGGKVLVPRELDDLALRSHLFLMHGHLDNEQDVDRAKLSDVHGKLHASECAHVHVNRSELPS